MNVLIMFLIIFCLFWSISFSGTLEFCMDRCGLAASDSLFAVDDVSLVFLLMLLLCGLPALRFCDHYLSGDIASMALLRLMLMCFLGVMLVLVFSYNFLMTLVMWEYLGVVSFFLILFYGNLDSFRATVVTIFASRFGDVCLFLLLLYCGWGWVGIPMFYIISVLMVVLTKSACFPFTSWLLEAMRAPTPVSSLVHSSTLVAAGVWFIFRYGGGSLILSFEVEYFFFVLAMSSIVISSVCSLVFLDLKKVVALSTCNNISWCIVFFLFGDVCLGLFQLLSHGVAKCYLFISLGDLMSGSSSSQDCRGVYCSVYEGFFGYFLRLVLVLSLSGIPFLGIFFSKHGLLSSFMWDYSYSCFFLLFISFFLSCVYSFRFLGLLSGSYSVVYAFSSSFVLVSSLGMLCCFLNFLCFFGGLAEAWEVDSLCVVLLSVLQFLGCLVGGYLYFSPLRQFLPPFGSFVCGCEAMVNGFYSTFSSTLYFFLFLLFRWEFRLGFWSIDILSSLGRLGGGWWRSLKFIFSAGLCFFFLFLVFF